MTQPETAVGGASDTFVAAEPTLEDRLSAAIGDEAEQPRKQEGEAETPQGTEAAPEELTEDDLEGPEAEGSEAEPLITPPVSWTAEEKATFAELPPAQQKIIARREAERESFLQTKANEAKQVRETVTEQANQHIQQLQAAFAQNLQALLPQIPEKPSHMLSVDDPYAYAEQMEAHEWAVAQHQWAQQQLQTIGAQQQQKAQAEARQKADEMRTTLAEKWPEFLSPASGPKLQQELGSIMTELGLGDLNNADAGDILALKEVSGWRAKAQKYDTLMAQKMDRVRAAKDLPKVTRPGSAQPKGAAAQANYQRDRELMQGGDMQAAARAVSRFI
jgi:hypothetical protein